MIVPEKKGNIVIKLKGCQEIHSEHLKQLQDTNWPI